MDKATATTLNRQVKQKVLQEIAAPKVPDIEDEPAVEVEEAKKFRLLEDITLSLSGTGPIRLRQGQVIEDPRMLYELKLAQAKLRPIA